MKIDQARLSERIFAVLCQRTERCTRFERFSQLSFKRRSGLLDVAFLGRIELLDQGFRVSIEPEDEIFIEDVNLLPDTLEFVAKTNFEARGNSRIVYDFDRRTVSAVSFLCCIDEPSDQAIVETVEEPIFLLVRTLAGIFGERDEGKRRPSKKK